MSGSFSRFEVCGIGRFLSLYCSDRYCGWRAALAAAVITLASCEYTNDESVEKMFDHMLACRQALQIITIDGLSNKLGSLDATHRVLQGLRSQRARDYMSGFTAVPPNNCRWVHGTEVVRWWKSSSTDLVSFEKYFPGWLFWFLFLVLSPGGWIRSILGWYNISGICLSPRVLFGPGSYSLISDPFVLFVVLSPTPP